MATTTLNVRATEEDLEDANLDTPDAGDLNAAARRVAAERGWAMDDGSYPIRPADMHGAADLDKAINAVGRGDAPHNAIRRHIMSRAEAIGEQGQIPDNWNEDGSLEESSSRPKRPPRFCYRAVEFAAEPSSDGRTLEGYAAIFDSPARIDSIFEGEFDEQISRGAFRRTLNARAPKLQFDHGQDMRTGSVPIGAIQSIREDDRGLFVRAELFDNDLVLPIRQAIAGGAIDGMSFRFRVNDDQWSSRTGDVDLRTIREVELFELGPVVFPAYESTTVGVRSLLAHLDSGERQALIRDLAAELRIIQESPEPDQLVTSGASTELGQLTTSGSTPAQRRERLYAFLKEAS